MNDDDDDNLQRELASFRACMSIIWVALAVLAAIFLTSILLKALH